MRVLGAAVVTVAVTSYLWTSGMAAGQATQPSERRNLMGVWGARLPPGPQTERLCTGLDGQEPIGHDYR